MPALDSFRPLWVPSTPNNHYVQPPQPPHLRFRQRFAAQNLSADSGTQGAVLSNDRDGATAREPRSVGREVEITPLVDFAFRLHQLPGRPDEWGCEGSSAWIFQHMGSRLPSRYPP